MYEENCEMAALMVGLEIRAATLTRSGGRGAVDRRIEAGFLF